ncbi:MAG TPA: HAD family hydrolase [Syntrophorhabdaceae bacterium]|nr:HAD family hydrolase [Syntrophorhabdaceae bacterium]
MKAAIFDFDGTLTPLTLNFDILKQEITRVALRHLPPNVVRSFENHFIIEMIHGLGDTSGIDGPAFEREAFNSLESLELEASAGKHVFPYTREVLGELGKKGLRRGIITRTSIRVVEQVFPDVHNYIETIITREHTRQVKPDPVHVERALENLSVNAEDAIMIGDHPTDIEAGSSAGTKTAGVLTGRTTRLTFEQCGASFVFSDIRDLLGII